MPEYKNTAGKKKPRKSNNVLNTVRVLSFWVIVAIFVGLLMGGFNFNKQEEVEKKSITEVLALVNDGKIEKITVHGTELYVTPKEDSGLKPIVSRKEAGSSLLEQGFDEAVRNQLVNIEVEEVVDIWGNILDIAIIVLPVVFNIYTVGMKTYNRDVLLRK